MAKPTLFFGHIGHVLVQYEPIPDLHLLGGEKKIKGGGTGFGVEIVATSLPQVDANPRAKI